MVKVTEQSSPHRHLEKKSVEELTALINAEDATVAAAIREALPAVNALIGVIVARLKAGGRMYYIGAGSGGQAALSYFIAQGYVQAFGRIASAEGSRLVVVPMEAAAFAGGMAQALELLKVAGGSQAS